LIQTKELWSKNYNPVELEEWIQGMEKIFIVVEVLGDKKMNIGTFYLMGEADIWRNTVKNKLLGPDFTWSRFVE